MAGVEGGVEIPGEERLAYDLVRILATCMACGKNVSVLIEDGDLMAASSLGDTCTVCRGRVSFKYFALGVRNVASRV